MQSLTMLEIDEYSRVGGTISQSWCGAVFCCANCQRQLSGRDCRCENGGGKELTCQRIQGLLPSQYSGITRQDDKTVEEASRILHKGCCLAFFFLFILTQGQPCRVPRRRGPGHAYHRKKDVRHERLVLGARIVRFQIAEESSPPYPVFFHRMPARRRRYPRHHWKTVFVLLTLTGVRGPANGRRGLSSSSVGANVDRVVL